VRRALLILGWAALAAGCGGGGTTGTPDASTPFLAFATDFTGYHGWPSYDTSDAGTLVGIHDGRPITEYINTLPPHGSTSFPVGTIVVKEVSGLEPDGGTHPVLAMVKRGGGFNASGSDGWEWFEIAPHGDDKDTVHVVWRGVGPPIGDTYGGDASAGCNVCHVDCGNDSVCAHALSLSNF
jgi:hypothetical protein